MMLKTLQGCLFNCLPDFQRQLAVVSVRFGRREGLHSFHSVLLLEAAFTRTYNIHTFSSVHRISRELRKRPIQNLQGRIVCVSFG